MFGERHHSATLRSLLIAVLLASVAAHTPLAGAHEAPPTDFTLRLVDTENQGPDDLVPVHGVGVVRQLILTLGHGRVGHMADGFLVAATGDGTSLRFDAEASYWTQHLRGSRAPQEWNVEARDEGRSLWFTGGSVAEGNTFTPYLTFDVIGDQDDAVDLTVTAFNQDDGALHVVGSGATLVAVDGIAPRVHQAVMLDGGSRDRPDGSIDLIHITFARPIDPTTLRTEAFRVPGYDILAAEATTEGGTGRVMLSMEPGPVPDTGARLLVDMGADALRDAHGVPVQAGTFSVEDQAAPILVAAHGTANGTRVALRFSEPVYGSGLDGRLALDDLAIEGGSAPGIDAVHHAAGNATAWIDMARPWAPAEDASFYVAARSSVHDAAGNAAASSRILGAGGSDQALIDLAATPAANPTALTLSWRTPEGAGPDASIHFVFDATGGGVMTDLAFDAMDSVIVPAGAPGDRHEYTVSDFRPETTYHIAARLVYAEGPSSPLHFATATTAPLDATPPGPIDLVWQAGAFRLLDDGRTEATFQWNTSQDAESAVAYHVALSPHEAFDWDEMAANAIVETPTWTVARAPGGWFFHVAAHSAGGFGLAANLSTPFPDLYADAVADYQRAVTVAIEEGPDGPLVAWTLPENPPAPVRGVRVFQESRGEVLLLEDRAADPGMPPAELEHAALALAPDAMGRIVVAPYFGPAPRDGAVDVDDQRLTTLASAPVPVETGGFGFWTWLLWIVAGIAVVVAVVALLVRAARAIMAKRGPAARDDPAPVPVPRPYDGPVWVSDDA